MNSSFVIPNYNTRMRGNERMNIHTICGKERERKRQAMASVSCETHNTGV